MFIDSQIRSLQNFADKFELTVKYYQFEDQRKKTKFIITNNKKFSTQPLTYGQANIYFLAIMNTKKHNL